MDERRQGLWLVAIKMRFDYRLKVLAPSWPTVLTNDCECIIVAFSVMQRFAWAEQRKFCSILLHAVANPRQYGSRAEVLHHGSVLWQELNLDARSEWSRVAFCLSWLTPQIGDRFCSVFWCIRPWLDHLEVGVQVGRATVEHTKESNSTVHKDSTVKLCTKFFNQKYISKHVQQISIQIDLRDLEVHNQSN